MSATTLESLLLAYGQNYPEPRIAPRRAKKLCAPCCHVVSYAPVRYCDAVSVEGGAYCARHRQDAASADQPAKFDFAARPKIHGVWRSRDWN